MSTGNITLGGYFADEESFLIKNSKYGNWWEPVPADKAQEFKNNWDNIVKTPQYVIKDDKIAFAGYKFGTNADTEQKEKPASAETAPDISNIRVRLENDLLIVTYDLSVKADIEAYVSLDDGATFQGPLKHVTGAVGKNVSIGKDKIFLWDAAKEVGYVDVMAMIKIVAIKDAAQEQPAKPKSDVAPNTAEPLKVAIGISSGLGIGGSVDYNIGGKLRVGGARIRFEGAFTYFFPTTITNAMSYNMWDASLNMHIPLSTNKTFNFYPLIGLSIFDLKLTYSSQNSYINDEYSGSATSVCFNTGGGFDVKLSDHWFLNGETKFMYLFVQGDTGYRFAASAGMVYRF
jgi:opacity protein-like surface antigen